MAKAHIHSLFKAWGDPRFRSLPRSAQALYAQLLSDPDLNNAGILVLRPRDWVRACEELTVAQVWADLGSLSDSRLVVVEKPTRELLIRPMICDPEAMAHKYILANAVKCALAARGPMIRLALAIGLYRLDRPESVLAADMLTADLVAPESHSNGIEIGSDSGGDDFRIWSQELRK